MRLLPVLLILCATLALAGCPKKPTTVPESSGATASEGSGASTGQGGTDWPGPRTARGFRQHQRRTCRGRHHHLFRLRPQRHSSRVRVAHQHPCQVPGGVELDQDSCRRPYG